MLKSFFGINNQIKFACIEEDWDVIPKPYSARKYIPEWFKALPMRIDNIERLNNSTVKRCVPFLDAMSVGYIIPLAADVEIRTNEDASGIEWDSKFYKNIIDKHGKKQITSQKSPHPSEHIPPLKFINHWLIQTPPGWSTLFIPPINREDNRFACIGGLVDTDVYNNFINFPFMFTQPNFTGIIPAGTPLVQAIPIKRDDILSKSKIEKFSESDYKKVDIASRKLKSHESYYRDEVVIKK
jgi:hypothetical protein